MQGAVLPPGDSAFPLAKVLIEEEVFLACDLRARRRMRVPAVDESPKRADMCAKDSGARAHELRASLCTSMCEHFQCLHRNSQRRNGSRASREFSVHGLDALHHERASGRQNVLKIKAGRMA